MHPRILEIILLHDAPPRKTLVVTPTYNEKGNIGAFMDAIAKIGADLLVIDDASPDGTADVVRAKASAAPMRVWLMRRQAKAGLGTAYLDAYRWLIETGHPYETVVQMDTDFSHDPSVVPALVAAAAESGVSIGSRYVPGGSCPDWPLHRRLLSRYANLYVRTVLSLRFGAFGVRDATAGFVAWRAEAVPKIFLKDIRSKGYAFMVETKLLAIREGYRPRELPIAFRERQHGVSKMDPGVILESLLFPWMVGR